MLVFGTRSVFSLARTASTRVACCSNHGMLQSCFVEDNAGFTGPSPDLLISQCLYFDFFHLIILIGAVEIFGAAWLVRSLGARGFNMSHGTDQQM